jgi:Cu/Ag efflux pump CusA
MISRVIEWCARNRFLVFTGTILLVLAGIWSVKNIPLDALPDISDVQVIVHIQWEGEPPSIIEDQVTLRLHREPMAMRINASEAPTRGRMLSSPKLRRTL